MKNRGLVVAYNGADAGLGNRIRVTLGAANLARAENRAFRYVWPQTPLFEPALSDIWDWREGRTMSRAVSRVMAKVTGYYDNTLSGIRRDASRPVWQVRTGGVLQLPEGVTPWEQSFRELSPVKEVSELVSSTFDRHLRDRVYVGVQLRVHAVSHQVTKEASPVEWYTHRMDEILQDRPDTAFYISCDVPEVKRRILAAYPTAVGLEHDAAYNSTTAVRHAVSDLYLLASSVHMLGPHHSSFIEMAQHLSSPSVTTEKAREGDAVPNWSSVPLARDPLTPHLR